MANTQINKLGALDPEEFNASRDKFLVQANVSATYPGTYKSSISNLIKNQAVDLPGSRSWSWNFLPKQPKIISYQRKKIPDHGKDEDASTLVQHFSAKIDRDSDTKEATGIPPQVRHLLCSAFIRNADLYYSHGRGQALVASEQYHTGFKIDPGFDGMPTESIFTIEILTLPEDITSSSQDGVPLVLPNFEDMTLNFEVRGVQGSQLILNGVQENAHRAQQDMYNIHSQHAERYLDIQRALGMDTSFGGGGFSFGNFFGSNRLSTEINFNNPISPSSQKSALSSSTQDSISQSEQVIQDYSSVEVPQVGSKRTSGGNFTHYERQTSAWELFYVKVLAWN
jgi:hypothetical protein